MNKSVPFPTINILGIDFFKGKVSKVFEFLEQNRGLMTVPSAPGLVTINNDVSYFESLKKSDVVIPDSGFMVLIWNCLSFKKLNKISGLEFINFFIAQPEIINNGGLFLINPSAEDSTANHNFLTLKGFVLSTLNHYNAPYYNAEIIDLELLSLLETQKPKWIMINIGGGTQEKLGLYLKENLSYKTAVMCTGAAIAFKTGRQVKMKSWVDKIYLGWLFRCISNPKLFIPRYLKGFYLINMILKFKLKI